MGRAPCCDKASVKKGPWSPEEDAMLKGYIEKHGTGGSWIALPEKAGLRRCGKSCRLRWLNYLRPNIKHGDFTDFEDRVICSLYASIGSRWSVIAAHLPGRTDNDIKNYWNTKLKKKFTALLPPLPSIPHRSSLTSSLQSNNTFISAPLPPLNSHSHQIPSPPLPALVSPSYSILPALRSPSKKEINFENPMQQYQVRKDGNSVNFGGGSGEATSSLSEAKYDFGRPCSSTAGGAHQAASYGHYPCRAVEEKENLLPASGRGDSSDCAAGGGWTQVVVADKAWGENTTSADYGFEQFEQLLVSTNSSSNCSFSFDENKVGEIACTTDRLWC